MAWPQLASGHCLWKQHGNVIRDDESGDSGPGGLVMRSEHKTVINPGDHGDSTFMHFSVCNLQN